MVFSVVLESRKNAGKDASFSPDVLVWHDGPLNRPPVDERSDPFNDLACLRVIGIEQPAGCSQLGLSDSRMPCVYGS